MNSIVACILNIELKNLKNKALELLVTIVLCNVSPRTCV
jgi:hypothetical protein